MLIEMFVENFRSIKERQSFSLTKEAGGELEGNAFQLDTPNNVALLRSAAIYGANAAGKSNFIRAIGTMKTIVRDSAKESQRGDKLPVTPFRLSRESLEAPTEFEILFVAEGVKYQYGFSLTNNKIMDEWLFAFPKGRPSAGLFALMRKKKKSMSGIFHHSFMAKNNCGKSQPRLILFFYRPPSCLTVSS